MESVQMRLKVSRYIYCHQRSVSVIGDSLSPLDGNKSGNTMWRSPQGKKQCVLWQRSIRVLKLSREKKKKEKQLGETNMLFSRRTSDIWFAMPFPRQKDSLWWHLVPCKLCNSTGDAYRFYQMWLQRALRDDARTWTIRPIMRSTRRILKLSGMSESTQIWYTRSWMKLLLRLMTA